MRGLFEVEPQPPLLVKGVDLPMQTCLVRAVRDRSVASVERGVQGLATPLAGRQAELQRLVDTAASVWRNSSASSRAWTSATARTFVAWTRDRCVTRLCGAARLSAGVGGAQ